MRKHLSSSSITMLMGIAKLSLAIALSFTFTFSLWNIIICVHEKFFNELKAVDTWLEENHLGQYQKLFRNLGKNNELRIKLF